MTLRGRRGGLRRGPAWSRTCILEPVAKGLAVLFVAEKGVGDDEAGVGFPGVDAVAAFATAADDVFAVEDDEGEAEADLHFGLPLGDDGGRAGDDDALDLLTHDHFAEDEAGFDGFAEADVVGNEEVDAREEQGFAEGFQLVGHDLDASAVGGLEEFGVGGGDEVPADGVEVGGEFVGRVEAAGGDVVPVGRAKNFGIDFALPEDREAGALGVVVQAGEVDQGLLPVGIGGRIDVLDEIATGANENDGSSLRKRKVAGTV